MVFEAITAFPEYFRSPLKTSLFARGMEGGVLQVHVHDLRDFCTDKHRIVDDYPYGGGAGMVMKAEPFFRAVEGVLGEGNENVPVILLTPGGATFNQQMAEGLAQHERLVLLCGHYEGVDQRVGDYLATRELSIGDYVVSGGEVAALVVMEALARFVPGFLGNVESLAEESHSVAGRVEYPQYTRPADFRGMEVPEVLLSGHHEEIRKWRQAQSEQRSCRREAEEVARRTK